MADLRLVIGDKNASPFSLKAWLTLKQLGLEFEEEVVRLRRPDTAELVRRHSPSGRLPLLYAGEIKVWDSLAINEFLADHFEQLWPAGAEARAVARSVAAEMHGGFTELRRFLPMDVTARFTPPGRLLTGVAAEVRRVAEIWHDCRGRFGQGGPFLFGAYTVADAMMAPVCTRFVTYALPLDELCQAYVEHVTGLPAMLEWAEGAAAEVAAAGPRPAVPARSPMSVVADDDREDEPDLEPVAIGADEDDEEDTGADAASGPPAPGLPGVLPTRAYAERDGASWSAARAQARAPGREVRFEEAAGGDEDDDGRPPAPGLPATVATRPYAGDEDAALSTYQPRRLVRPPGRSGLFSWRAPMPGTASPPPPPTVAPGPAPVLVRPEVRSEPPASSLPKSAPEEVATPASVVPPSWSPPPPAASRSDPDPAPPAPPRPARSADSPPASGPPAAEPSPPPPPPSPPSLRSTFRPETIKPIGTGIRRRR